MLNFPTSRVEICHVSLPIPNLPPQLDALRVVQLSDFHFSQSQSRSIHPRVLSDVIDQVQTLQPDLICYTGDFINGEPDDIEALCRRLKQISGRFGNFAVLGNHDYLSGESARQVTRALAQANIRVLANEICFPCGPGLALVGFKCLWPHFDPIQFDPAPILSQVPASMPKIVLAHSPKFSEFLTPWPIDLQLSGHTHGGQLALPGLGPLLPHFWWLYRKLPKPGQQYLYQRLPHRLRMTMNYRYLQGGYSLNQGLLYVNRGLGSHPPGRLFCRPEITAITLQRVAWSTQVSGVDAVECPRSEIKT